MFFYIWTSPGSLLRLSSCGTASETVWETVWEWFGDQNPTQIDQNIQRQIKCTKPRPLNPMQLNKNMQFATECNPHLMQSMQHPLNPNNPISQSTHRQCEIQRLPMNAIKSNCTTLPVTTIAAACPSLDHPVQFSGRKMHNFENNECKILGDTWTS